MAIDDKNIPKIELEELRYPEISFSKAAPEVPATSETTGNVTINNPGRPAEPSFFEAMLNIPVKTTWNGIDLHSGLFLRLPVPTASDMMPYRDVCELALDQLAPLLRSLADQIEQDLEEVGKARLAKPAE